MCTIKLKSMSFFITKFPTLIVWDIMKQATQFSVLCDFYVYLNYCCNFRLSFRYYIEQNTIKYSSTCEIWCICQNAKIFWIHQQPFWCVCGWEQSVGWIHGTRQGQKVWNEHFYVQRGHDWGLPGRVQHEIPQHEEQGETFLFANKVRIIENLLVLLNHFFICIM